MLRKNLFKALALSIGLIIVFGSARNGFADLYLNILAVNGTEVTKDKDIHFPLPSELTAEDIIDTDGLEVDYDVTEGSYFVHGSVTLNPKETKTYKILIRDLWQIQQDEVELIQTQIEKSLNRLEGTEYYETGKIKEQSLLSRLDFLVQEQEKYADDIEKRIDSYRIYSRELREIRDNAISVKYWRSKPPSVDEADVFYFIVELENTTEDKPKISKKKNYLPREVKPEHFIDLQDFDLRYDALKGKSYLIKEEELKPKEVKRYSIGIIDIWNVKQGEIDNLKDRAREAYKFIEPTDYVDDAKILMTNIKKNLDAIELTQSVETNINEHISIFRTNSRRFDIAYGDVEALEELLEIIREELKRSKVENVLKKIRGIRSIADISENLLKKPTDSTTWNIIIAIIGFVGLYTIIHFAIWGARSKNAPVEEEEPEEEQKES